MDKIDTTSLFQVNPVLKNSNFIRRFQSHAAFISLCFDIRRQSHNNSKVYVQMTWNTFPKTRALLEQMTSEEPLEAAEQAWQYRPITNPAIKELLKAITWIRSSSAGADENKSHMLVELSPQLYITDAPLYSSPLILATFIRLFPYTMREKRLTPNVFYLSGTQHLTIW